MSSNAKTQTRWPDSGAVMHVVSHTHWDREWYLPFQGFRMKLVDLMDHLLDILESDPTYACFHMDGQTIVIEDYLEIRPENAERLEALIKAGRIIIGPWYVQPDEFLPSGEAHIRNLLAGKAFCERYGVDPLAAGYVIDLFGHISQFPQIMKGFGISHALLFRGVYRDLVPNEFLWEGPDGSSLLTFHLHDDFAYSTFWYNMHCGTPGEMGRYFGGHRPPKKTKEAFDLNQAAERAKWLRDELAKGCGTRHILFMDGIDHIEPNPHIPAVINAINSKIDEGFVVHSSLNSYMAAVDDEIDFTAVPRLDGELRWPNKDGNLNSVLVGTLSSRIGNKLDNDMCQRLLERWVEPFVAMASLHTTMSYPRTYVEKAWRWLMQNHPHDSICGCSIDQVHKDMVYRFDQCRLIGQGLVDRALSSISQSISVKELNDGEMQVVAFNARKGEATGVQVLEFQLDTSRISPQWDLIDCDGNKLSVQILESKPTYIHELCGHDVPSFRGGTAYRVAVDFSRAPVPSVGYTSLRLVPRTGVKRTSGSMVTGPATIENESLKVTVNGNGTLCIVDKASSQVFDSLCYFEDRGDVGDGWNWISPEFDREYLSTSCRAAVSLEADGPLAVTLKVQLNMPVPVAASADRRTRSQELVELPIVTYVTLRKGSKMVEVETTVDNIARDHRFRVVLPTLVTSSTYVTDTQFDVVTRDIVLPDCSEWREAYPTTAPLQNFVAVTSESRSLGAVVQGIRECSVYDRSDRAIAVTLLRGFINAVATTGNEGGQVLGKHTFKYGLCPGQGSWQQLDLYGKAEELTLPLVSKVVDKYVNETESLPKMLSFVDVADCSVSGAVQLSSVKLADKGDDLVVRVFNPGRDEAKCEVKVSGMKTVKVTSLDESFEGESLAVVDSTSTLSLPKAHIMTLKVSC